MSKPRCVADNLRSGVDEFPDQGTTIISQHGMIAGYSAYIGLERSKNLAVIVLCNNFNWDDKVGHNLLLTLSRNFETVQSKMIRPGRFQ